ncbi:hypothetical protein NP493_1684g00004 [Ridgeia piscesae]|uniref:Uncharacterized protein n=1 Tax=Ridgeia piscesae TaxID=27915 RepID=A0AAD9JW39_RIDPI|nr:hypothetical protein NP493_1684g00004 [Ridgeia piscesae]
MPRQRKRKSKEPYGVGRRKRLKQLQFASDAKRIGDENGASATSGPATSMATMPALESETLDIVDAGSDISSNSTVSGDSDKECSLLSDLVKGLACTACNSCTLAVLHVPVPSRKFETRLQPVAKNAQA